MLTLAVYGVLGFFFTWIANAVTREDIPMRNGVMMLLVTGIAWFVITLAAPAFSGVLTFFVFHLAALTVLSWLVCDASWKHSVIIATAYTIFLFLVLLGVGYLLG